MRQSFSYVRIDCSVELCDFSVNLCVTGFLKNLHRGSQSPDSYRDTEGHKG
jgi:hypothetical protein